ncbi:MAG: FAD-dependent oxidoreductase [Anaerolineae bacterium]|nr:FAD-dependent oxidoreductase [Anaerolineae bacterium]
MTLSPEIVGAALVVGGGIAGVQAALDMANAGVKVYLVEQSPAIGGKMVQLDKTFPTNDCAICISSPKLVEAGRHPNIDLLTQTDLVGLQGQAGRFRATVRRRPRYVDVDKCTACADCVEVCPVSLPDTFNLGLATRTAIYRPYAQAVPNKYAITKRGTSPCKATCPAETSAQGYINLIAAGRYVDALKVVMEYNPFPATVGRVCHHPCEDECSRGRLDSPVAICALKRFVADWVYEHAKLRQVMPVAPANGRRVAVVGAGPAGLTATHFLAHWGYQVTVYEALPVPGGMMRVGIPPYRLPRDVLQREMDAITALPGVELVLSHPIRNINGLFERGYEAVVLAIGAHEPQLLGIPGEDAAGVTQGVPFLRTVSLGEDVEIGKRVLVVGGGNTAVDTARTALRLGAREVYMLYRRSRAEMPASEEEIEQGEAEGVRLELLTQPIEVLVEDGHISALRCVRMRLGEPDASGRRRPVPIPGSEFSIQCDQMVAAVAQAPEISFLDPDHGLAIDTRRRTFIVDERTLATNRPGVFAGGDAVRGPAALIEAIAHGRRAALSVDRYLRGVPLLTPREELPLPTVELDGAEMRAIVESGTASPRARVAMSTVPPEARRADFREVALALSEEEALAEAERCLRCGLCSECHLCVEACKPEAVDHYMAPVEETLDVGAVVLSPGYTLYDAESSPEWGYGRYANVVTALQFERMLSASGPTLGHVARPSDGAVPARIGFLQCVGSRDQAHPYCSSVCCMYATKEGMLAMQHLPGVEVHVFQMDMRAFGKNFDAYYRRGQELGIVYHNCRLSVVREDPQTKQVVVRYQADDGSLCEMALDLLVLSVGMEPPANVAELARSTGIALNEHGFALREPFHPVETSREGVYVCGAFAEPKDIPDSVVEAGGAAGSVLALLGKARGTLVEPAIYPPEQEVSLADEPRIGCFICSCGSNIAGVIDVAQVTQYAASLPNVVHAENTIYTCSADSLKLIQERIAEHRLNRVIVASCTPRTHEPIFRDTIRGAGLNPYLFEMANIRDQGSWVHASAPARATDKAQDLVRMAVARARLLFPLHTEPEAFNHDALIVGGGVAGMTAALNLADQGYAVHLVEREATLGGRARQIYHDALGGDTQAFLTDLVRRVRAHERIEVLNGHRIVKHEGYVGSMRTTVEEVGTPRRRLLEHGVVILATGAREYAGPAYGLGTHPAIVTQGELEERLAQGAIDPAALRTVVMIQCVGPWDEDGDAGDEADFYCSRVCCTVAAKNALRIKELNPAAQVIVLYKDVRTYGFREQIYTQARQQGVIYVRFGDAHKPEVVQQDGGIRVHVTESSLNLPLTLEPDLVVLSAAMVPPSGTRELAEMMKLSCTLEGFMLEAHLKLQPVDFPTEGAYLCGAVQYPKFLDEAIAQAKAAAARAAAILSQDVLQVGGVVAVVDPLKCTGCLTCVRACPYDVPVIDPAIVGAGGILGAAQIAAAACRGCGLCAAECPAKAIQLQHYRDEQVLAKEEALFVRDPRLSEAVRV